MPQAGRPPLMGICHCILHLYPILRSSLNNGTETMWRDRQNMLLSTLSVVHFSMQEMSHRSSWPNCMKYESLNAKALQRDFYSNVDAHSVFLCKKKTIFSCSAALNWVACGMNLLGGQRHASFLDTSLQMMPLSPFTYSKVLPADATNHCKQSPSKSACHPCDGPLHSI